ncbi:MAG TPA: proton-conducting transporter membrane subunit [Streptosporangiaceae bacterium]
MIAFAAAAIAVPFAAALTVLLPPGRVRWTGPAVHITAAAASALLTLVVAVALWRDAGVRTGTLAVAPTGTLPIGIGLYVDRLSAVVALMVGCVAAAVQTFAAARPASTTEAGGSHRSFAASVSLFTAAMLLVVYAGDLIVLYAGWEVMGLCAYVLIGRRGGDGDAGGGSRAAAVKAFLMTRAGDAGFMFGIFVLGVGARTFSVRGVLAHHYPHATALAGASLLLAGVVAKSAQFPLHTWLPEAMVAPVPAGALMTAATMVPAGVYAVARLFPVFLQAPGALAALAVVASITMLGAALAALAQDDLTQVLAYSTISQLACMAASLAAGARDAAILYLLAHGAAAALLFLGAGCVRAMAGTIRLPGLGGLRLAMPVTFWSMTAGWAAVAGVPVAAGFFGKDAIVAAVQHAAIGGAPRPAEASGAMPAWAAVLLYVTLLLTVAATAAYATRAWLMTFFGEPRGRAPGREVREAPPLMRWPVAALAVPALVLGFFGLGSAGLRPEPGPTAVLLALVAAGAGAAFVVWNRDPALDPARVLGRRPRTVLERGFSVDAVYGVAVVRPILALARLVATADDRVVAAAVGGAGRGVRRLGGLLRATEGGNPQAYVTGLLAGVAVIAVVVVVFT